MRVGRPSFKVRSAASGNYYFACLALPSLYFSNNFSFQVQSLCVGNRMVFSDYLKQRIIFFKHQGLKPTAMSRLLKAEGLEASVVGIYNFLRRYEENGHIKRMPGSGRPSKVTVEVKDIVEAKMQEDDETTAVQLKCYLDGKYCNR